MTGYGDGKLDATSFQVSPAGRRQRSAMVIWATINSIGLLLLANVLYVALRQIGLMLGRLGPVGARSTADLSPRIGEYISQYTARIALEQSDLSTLYLFAGRSCSVCGAVREAAEALVPQWRGVVRIVMIYDKLPIGGSPPKSHGLILAEDTALRGDLGIGFVPFGVLVDAGEKVLARGLVNEISHVESLLEAAGDLAESAASASPLADMPAAEVAKAR